jgi:antitoxin Phd
MSGEHLREPSGAAAWKLHEAKARFSELFRRVRTQGPQRVVRQGGEEVVVIRAEEYDRLRALGAQPESLVEFFRQAPVAAEPLELERKRDATRVIEW